MMAGELRQVDAMPSKDSDPRNDSDHGPVVIKKYGNRRLYDTRQSKYITLEDLAAIVQAGATVQVIDSTTSKDLTRQVLMQVILEHQESLDVVPVDLLHAVLRVRGTLEQAPLAAFLTSMTGQFVQRGNQWARQISDLMGSFPMTGVPGFAGSAPAQTPPDANPAPSAEHGNEVVDAEPPDTPQSSPELHNVRNRMDALLSKMKKG
jgi:polyhydroxyalkanoate synthesis repressor PhaR